MSNTHTSVASFRNGVNGFLGQVNEDGQSKATHQSILLTDPTNQIVLGNPAATTTTISAPPPAANRLVTIPDDPGANSSVVLSSGGNVVINNAGAVGDVLIRSSPLYASWGAGVLRGWKNITLTDPGAVALNTAYTGAYTQHGGNDPYNDIVWTNGGLLTNPNNRTLVVSIQTNNLTRVDWFVTDPLPNNYFAVGTGGVFFITNSASITMFNGNTAPQAFVNQRWTVASF